ncbi:rod shape-determining protein MreD [Nocardioides sp. TRM66260-LWL]|uniref:rod shape-determining protein MreD n=1 Tax=Nocardioides sp. TRM66260-LWL TaxID=2874478 RepID=UPI001CC420F0|nr:rod shape-determining protein MreD [Nocardioides sp. TRM66260-LWL]MBZ5733040.1 rod shape-determining protein MreD [Nocardioides sp. TRM66260-LWL]
MTGPLGALRASAVLAIAALATLLQVSLAPHLAWRGVGPDLALLVVVAAGLAWGAHSGLLLGFGAGVVLDLVPPADHLVGRWALALMVVGYVAGRVRADLRPDRRPALGTIVATAAACSFVGTSVFALSGLVLGDATTGVGGLLGVILASVVWDVALAVLLVPVLLRALARLEPEHAR